MKKLYHKFCSLKPLTVIAIGIAAAVIIAFIIAAVINFILYNSI